MWHTRARARATFACALAFACRSFKLAPHATRALPEYLEMCIIFATRTWPENPADAILEVLNSKILLEGVGMTQDPPTLRSTIYVALHVPKHSGVLL